MDRRKVLISAALYCLAPCSDAAEAIQFNTDMLDVKDRQNLDLNVFSVENFIMPGQYSLSVKINSTLLGEQTVTYIATEGDPKNSQLCLSIDQVDLFGLNASAKKALTWWNGGECLDLESIPGMQARGELSTSTLHLSIPQESLDYVAPNWDPPSRWDEGIPGILFDYSVNAQSTDSKQAHGRRENLSGNGVAGLNIGSWRLRGDWQAQIDRGAEQTSRQQFTWSRLYAYTALPSLRSSLSVGEDYLNSELFGSFRYTGASLNSNESMLPPNLRGYAPEIRGVAKSNARVVILQQGRVLYSTQVPPGPFRIRDLNDAVSGKLDVHVEEQDGSLQEFQVDTASIPYLTRPGTVRYKLTAGQPSDWQHNLEGSSFTTGEASWGVANGWSLYGGALAAKDYQSIAVGVGRDLSAFGAISFDVTQSQANAPELGTMTGKSYRTSYSKRFDEYDSQVTFAGYRFSEKNYLSMGEFLETRRDHQLIKQSKELYTATFSKQFVDAGLNVYFNYNHQTYWNNQPSDRYSASLSRYFNIGRLKNVSVSLNAYRSLMNNGTDDGVYLSMSIPWDGGGSISYSASINRGDSLQNLSYYDQIDEQNHYSLSAGTSKSAESISGFLSHSGDLAQIVASASHQTDSYSSMGLSIQGGLTATTKGAALHRNTVMGGTRLIVDTQGISDVPVRGQGNTTRSNVFGKAVIADVNNYYRNQVSIELDKLADDIEATRSTSQATLTEGAIGYRQFDVISGKKAMVRILLDNNEAPPFGATVKNNLGQETGIIGEAGSTYLNGMGPGRIMSVYWDGEEQCHFTVPNESTAEEHELELLCQTNHQAGDA